MTVDECFSNSSVRVQRRLSGESVLLHGDTGGAAEGLASH